jgi:Holliday junction resolvase RusA-like endonuclease
MIHIDLKPMSVNVAWKGRRIKSKEYKKYERDLFFLLPILKIPTGYLSLQIEFGFSNKGSDWDNPIKPFQDVLQKKYNINDNMVYEATVRKMIVPKGKH